MDVSKTGIQPKAPTSVTRADAAAPATSAKTTKATEQARKDPGPAATVDISNEARNRLRQAGAASADIAKVNLKDRGAVDRAVQKARAQHASTQHAAAPAKTASASAATASTTSPSTTTTDKASSAKTPSKRPSAAPKK